MKKSKTRLLSATKTASKKPKKTGSALPVVTKQKNKLSREELVERMRMFSEHDLHATDIQQT